MAQFASDAFGGTSGQTLQVYSASWVKHTSAGARELKISAAARAYADSGAGDACVYNTGTPASADYTVSADLVYIGASSSNLGVLGRVNTAATTYYHARYDTTSGGWQLYKRVAGTFTQLGSTSTQTFSSGTKNLLLSMVGSTIALYKEGGGSPTISASDSAITAAGYSGLRASADTSSSIHADTFSADDVSSGVTGTLATTNANDTLVSSGSTTIVGTLAKTNANDTAAASGNTGSVSGTLATTNANDSVVAVGSTTILGSLAKTNNNDSLASTGVVGSITGTLARTNANDTLVASGTSGTTYSATIKAGSWIRYRIIT